MSTPLWFVGTVLDELLRELALWSGVPLAIAGALALYHGWKQRQVAALVRETPRSDVGDVRSPGVVRVRGAVVPKTETESFASPVGGDEECVLAAWEIEERYDAAKSRSWEPAAWGVDAAPFYVEDGTGKLLVDVDDRVVGNETDDLFAPERLLATDGVSVDGLRCEFDSFDVRVETDAGESPPRRIAEFIDSTEGVSDEPMTRAPAVNASERKYREGTLQAGSEVSVVGYAQPRRDALVSAAGPGDLVVTQSDEATLHLSTRPMDGVSRGGGSVLFGVLVGGVGVALVTAALAL